MDNWPACISVHCVPIWWPWRPEKGIRSSRHGVTDVCELPCGGWKSNQCPLEEQRAPFTAESRLQPLSGICVRSVLLSLLSNCAFISRSVHNRHPIISPEGLSAFQCQNVCIGWLCSLERHFLFSSVNSAWGMGLGIVLISDLWLFRIFLVVRYFIITYSHKSVVKEKKAAENIPESR